MALVDPQQIATTTTHQANGFFGMPVVKQLGFLIVLAASIALGISAVIWMQEPSYNVLFNNLSDKDASEVTQILQQSDIPYQVDRTSGAIMVDGGRIHDARLKLAAEGLPRGSGLGYEVLDQEEKFGVSQFMETTRYQRALEGELARTISTINSVKSARVHLAIPKQSAFIRNRRPPSASVVVNLYAGRTLEKGQAQAISHLVASGIPNLELSQVTIIDQKGRLLTNHDEDGMANSKQLEYVKEIEQAYINRIENILIPVVGLDKIRAQVTAEVDFTMSEHTQELFNPDTRVVRSERTLLENNGGNGMANGVPGALSNQPPEGGNISNNNNNKNSEAVANSNMRKSTTRNYEVDKTISHTRLSAGKVRRLSVAVVVDNKAGAEDAAPQPYTEEELGNLERLVKDAVGFNAPRGDTVNISNVAFSQPEAVADVPAVPLWEKAWLWDALKQGGGVLLVLLLVFGVLKPVLRELATKGQEIGKMIPAEQYQQFMAAEDGTMALPGQETAAQLQQKAINQQVETAKDLASKDPKRVAQVVRNWVGEE